MQEIKTGKIIMNEDALKKLAESLDLPHAQANRLKAKIMLAVKETGQDRAAILDASFVKRPVWLLRLTFASVVGFALLGGSVIASANSLPGDKLYPIKQAKEQLELQLASRGQPKAMVLAKHAQERLNELSILKNAPTEENAKHQGEVKNQANIQVKNAVDSLSRVKQDLEDKGNAKAAAAVDDALNRLVASAKKAELEVENRMGNADEKEGRKESSNKDEEDRKRPEGEVKGEWHKPESGKSQTSRKPKNQAISLPVAAVSTTTATSVAPLLPNDSPKGEVLGTSTQGSLDAGEGAVIRVEPERPGEAEKQESEQQKHLEEQKNEAENKSAEEHGD